MQFGTGLHGGGDDLTGGHRVAELLGHVRRQLQLGEGLVHLVARQPLHGGHLNRRGPLGQRHGHLGVMVQRGAGVGADGQCHARRQRLRVLVVVLVVNHVVESRILQRLQRILGVGGIRVEDVLGDRGLTDALGYRDGDLAAVPPADMVAHVQRLGGGVGRQMDRDDVPLVNRITEVLGGGVRNVRNGERAAVIVPIGVGDGAVPPLRAGDVVRLGERPIAAGAAEIPPGESAATDGGDEEHDDGDDDDGPAA